MQCRRFLRGITETPRRIVLHRADHFVNQSRFFFPFGQYPHRFEKSVIAGVTVVARIFTAVTFRLAVGTIKKRKKILRIRIVRNPTPVINLSRPAVHLILKAVVVRPADFKLNADLGKLPGKPLQK